MWTFVQSTGELRKDGVFVATGYSGYGDGRNNPAMQSVPNAGPIPRNRYVIGALLDSETHGPECMHLTACGDAPMFGRDGFLIHGDSVVHPGWASHGCIVLPRSVRLQIGSSGDTQLEVV